MPPLSNDSWCLHLQEITNFFNRKKIPKFCSFFDNLFEVVTLITLDVSSIRDFLDGKIIV